MGSREVTKDAVTLPISGELEFELGAMKVKPAYYPISALLLSFPEILKTSQRNVKNSKKLRKWMIYFSSILSWTYCYPVRLQ